MLNTTQQLIKLANDLDLKYDINDKRVIFYTEDFKDEHSDLEKMEYITNYQSVVSYMTYCYIPCDKSETTLLINDKALQKLDFGGDLLQCTICIDFYDFEDRFMSHSDIKITSVANDYVYRLSVFDMLSILGMTIDEMKKEFNLVLDEDDEDIVISIDEKKVWNKVRELTAPDIQYIFIKLLLEEK